MWDRVEQFMLRTGKTWEETAQALQVTTAAMSYWKTGKTKPSKQALFRLQAAERSAGIVVPEAVPVGASSEESGRVGGGLVGRKKEELFAGGKGQVARGKGEEARGELRAIRDELKALLERVEKLLGERNGFEQKGAKEAK